MNTARRTHGAALVALIVLLLAALFVAPRAYATGGQGEHQDHETCQSDSDGNGNSGGHAQDHCDNDDDGEPTAPNTATVTGAAVCTSATEGALITWTLTSNTPTPGVVVASSRNIIPAGTPVVQ